MRFSNFSAAHAEVLHGPSQKRISYHQLPTGCQQMVHAIYKPILWQPPSDLLHQAKLADCNCKQLAATWCCLHFTSLIFLSTMRIGPHAKTRAFSCCHNPLSTCLDIPAGVHLPSMRRLAAACTKLLANMNPLPTAPRHRRCKWRLQ